MAALDAISTEAWKEIASLSREYEALVAGFTNVAESAEAQAQVEKSCYEAIAETREGEFVSLVADGR